MSATTIVVNDVEPRRQYTATASQTVFDFPIPFFADGDLTVWLTPVGQTSDDVADLLTITTHYTVTGANTQDGGQITLVTPATAGDIITIERIVGIERLADFQNSGDLLAETLNKEQDTEIFIAQQLRQDIERCVILPKTSTSGASLTLPNPASLQYLRWNTAADALENASGTTSIAADVTFTPVGDLASTDVQAALQELDTEKLDNADIGTTVQAYDADTAKTDVAQTFTISQRGTVTTDNDLSFDLNATNNFKCTPTANGTLTFTNITAGQSGFIWLDNSGGHVISAAATTYIAAADLSAVSNAGIYLLGYDSDGTNVAVTVSQALTSAGA